MPLRACRREAYSRADGFTVHEEPRIRPQRPTMSAARRLVLVSRLFVLVALVEALVPRVLMAYHSVHYVMGWANDPPGGPYEVTFGTDRPDALRGGPGDDLIASEGPWGDPPEDYRRDRVDGVTGDDFLDSVSLPYPEVLPVDVVRCGPGEDRVVADPQDDVGDDCEGVRRVNMDLMPEIGDPLREFPPETGTREYGPNPAPVKNSDL